MGLAIRPGKTVRKLVALLAKRTGLWREVAAGERNGNGSDARKSLYSDERAGGRAGAQCGGIDGLPERLERAALADLEGGKLQ